MATLVDTNVLLDLLTDDAVWSEWSVGALKEAASSGSLAINDVIYAELSVRFASAEDLDGVVGELGLTLVAMPRRALFLAAKAFQKYRTAGGSRTGVLPDFFIGAHAVAESMPLLTRDAARYLTYFPEIALIAPPRPDPAPIP